MGHDVHFLSRLNRVRPALADLALSLYRDPELVRGLLARVDLVDEAERVAIALEDGPSSPHVIVARNGHFVTCLGPGMKFRDLPVISRERVEREANGLAALRTAIKKATRLSADREAWWKMLLQPVRCGARLSRESYLELRSLTPILEKGFLEASVRAGTTLQMVRARLISRRPRADRQLLLERYWRNAWAMAHLNGLVLTPERMRDLTEDPLGCARDAGGAAGDGFSPLFLRFIVSTTSLGGAVLEALGKEAASEEPLCFFGAFSTLAATAVCHPELYREVEAIFRKAGETRLAVFHQATRPNENGELFGQTLGRETLFQLAEEAGLELPEHDAAEMERLAAAALVARPVPIDDVQAMEVLAATIPWLATRPFSDWYFPAAYLELAPAGPGADAEAILASFKRVYHPGPARAEPAPGRNDPCSCGSGRKFKKCCGG